jgi:hypothetical protein
MYDITEQLVSSKTIDNLNLTRRIAWENEDIGMVFEHHNNVWYPLQEPRILALLAN